MDHSSWEPVAGIGNLFHPLPLSWIHPVRRVTVTMPLAGNRHNRSPAGVVFAFMLQNHPHHTGANFSGKLVRCFVCHCSILSGDLSLRQSRGGSMRATLLILQATSECFQVLEQGAALSFREIAGTVLVAHVAVAFDDLS